MFWCAKTITLNYPYPTLPHRDQSAFQIKVTTNERLKLQGHQESLPQERLQLLLLSDIRRYT